MIKYMIKRPNPKIGISTNLIKGLCLAKLTDKSNTEMYNNWFIGDGLLNLDRSVMPKVCLF